MLSGQPCMNTLMTSFSPVRNRLESRWMVRRGTALLAGFAIILSVGIAEGQITRVAPAFHDTMANAAARDSMTEHTPDIPALEEVPFLPGEFLPAKLQKTTAEAEPVRLWGEPTAGAPQTLTSGFAGISLQNQFSDLGTGSIPPDTMGAVGPEHFMVVINGSVAIFEKATGERVSHVSLNSFFTATFDSINYPRNGAFDPRVLFDRATGRWIASALERGNPERTFNHVILAVSQTSDPTGAWYK